MAGLAGPRNAVALAPDLAVGIRQTSAGPALTGTAARYEVTLRNIGQAASTSGNVVVELPAGFTGATAGGSPFSCSVATTAGAAKITCQSGLMAIGQVRTFACSATAPRTITGNRQVFTVAARANPNALGPEGAATANNTATVSTAVETRGDLDPTWSGSPTSVTAGQEAVFRATLRNTGDGAIGGSVLRITIPVGQVSFVRFDNDRFSGGCGQPDAQGKLSCRTASLAAGASASVGIVTRTNALLLPGDRLLFQAAAETVDAVTLPAPGGRVDVPVRQLGPAERSTGNNVASLVATVGSAPLDLALSPIGIAPDATRACEPLNFSCATVRFKVENRGPGTYTGGAQLRIDHVGPCPATTYLVTSPSGLRRADCIWGSDPSGCRASGSDQTGPVGNLAPGTSRTVSFLVPLVRKQSGAGIFDPTQVIVLTVNATLDPANAVAESNENNNRATANYTYTP